MQKDFECYSLNDITENSVVINSSEGELLIRFNGDPLVGVTISSYKCESLPDLILFDESILELESMILEHLIQKSQEEIEDLIFESQLAEFEAITNGYY